MGNDYPGASLALQINLNYISIMSKVLDSLDALARLPVQRADEVLARFNQTTAAARRAYQGFLARE
jgi:hypothetical protein